MRSSRHKSFWKSVLCPPPFVRFRGTSADRNIALTFDDGPVDGLTERVLDLLHATRHRATFFVIGERAEARPGILKSIVDGGSEVGNHSFSHPKLSRLPSSQIAREFERTDSIVRSVLGTGTRYLRPPFGELSPKLLLYLARYRATAVLWSTKFGGYEDTFDQPSEALVQDFIGDAVGPGDIVLLHDTNLNVVRALPEVLSLLDRQNLTSVTLSGLLTRAN